MREPAEAGAGRPWWAPQDPWVRAVDAASSTTAGSGHQEARAQGEAQTTALLLLAHSGAAPGSSSCGLTPVPPPRAGPPPALVRGFHQQHVLPLGALSLPLQPPDHRRLVHAQRTNNIAPGLPPESKGRQQVPRGLTCSSHSWTITEPKSTVTSSRQCHTLCKTRAAGHTARPRVQRGQGPGGGSLQCTGDVHGPRVTNTPSSLGPWGRSSSPPGNCSLRRTCHIHIPARGGTGTPHERVGSTGERRQSFS